MGTRKCQYAVAFLLLLTSMHAFADQTPVSGGGTFEFEVKGTAAQQFSYASRLPSWGDDLSTRHLNVLRSVAALEVIPKRWPVERALGLRAYREMVSRLAGAQLHANTLAVCDQAMAFAGSSPDALVFVAAKGRSLMWLGRTDEARHAFTTATTGQFNRLDDFDKSSILVDATLFFERDKKFGLAARYAQMRARIAKGALSRVEALRKTLELRLLAREETLAKTDLAELVHALRAARMSALTPDEQEIASQIDTEIEAYRRKLGV